jgi:hypothetical protein
MSAMIEIPASLKVNGMERLVRELVIDLALSWIDLVEGRHIPAVLKQSNFGQECSNLSRSL